MATIFNDTLVGGAGADDFFYPGGILAGAVRILDFAPGIDDMLLSGTLGFATPEAARLSPVEVGADSVLILGGGQPISFAGRAAADFTADDFQIV